MQALPRLPFAGGVDADGHILEPPDVWERYIDPVYRDRAIRIRTDEAGNEFLDLGGRRSSLVGAGTLSAAGAMDRRGGIVYEREPTGSPYVDNAPLGAMDAKERIERLDLENLTHCFLYPTLSLFWISEIDDEDLTQAYVRAYNRFLVDFCADSGGRLIPVAQLSLGDPAAAEAELRRAAADGVKGAWVPPFTHTRKAVGHPDHDRVFAAAAELGVVLGLHPSIEPKWAVPGRYDDMHGREHTFYANVTAGDAIRHALTSMFEFGTFARFPELRVAVLETGAGWIGYWLSRMDAVYASPLGMRVQARVPEPPSHYFKRQCWISADPDENTLAPLIGLVGDDRFFWASDFPHPDHPPTYIPDLIKIVEALPDDARAGFLGQNVLRAYRIDEES